MNATPPPVVQVWEIDAESVVKYVEQNPRILESLDPRRRDIFRRLWLAEERGTLTYRAIAREYGVSQERIRQLVNDAFRTVRRAIRDESRQCPTCHGKGWL